MSKNTDLGNLVNGIFVSSTRNVGIGTSTPANAVVVDKGTATASYLQFTAGTTTGQLATDGFEVGIDASGNGIISQQENLPLMVYTNSAERMRINAVGNVGIGTSSPNNPLTIKADSSGNGINIISETSGYAQLSFSNADNTIVGNAITQVPFGTSFDMYLSTYNGTSRTTKMVISGSGNVGIGTPSPSANLHILKSTAGEVLRIESTATNTGAVSPYIQFVSANQVGGTGFATGYIGTMWTAEGNGFSMAFATKAVDGGQVERMRITSGGKVLIGTTTEAAEANLSLGANNTIEGGQILLQKGTSHTYASHLDNFGDTFRLLYGTNTGTSGLNFQVFHPSGNYSFSGSNVSDKRLKENINILTLPAIEKVNQLVPKTYNMISNPETLRYGFIAQEVQEILPDLITGTESETDVLGLDYNGILTLAVKAIQELSAEINILKNK